MLLMQKQVKGVGIILGGTLMRGGLRVGDSVFLGPDRSGVFVSVTVRSIECRRTAFEEIKTGQSATVCVKPVNRKIILKKSYFRKGMVIISELANLPKGADQTPLSIREFDASVVILHHSTTISSGYQPVIHCGVLRQSAQILGIQGTESLKTGERAIVRFRFLYFSEYILPAATFLFREGRAKGVGKVVQTYPTREQPPAQINRARAPALASAAAPAAGTGEGGTGEGAPPASARGISAGSG
jgi:GTPase